MKKDSLDKKEYDSYYGRYIGLVKNDLLISLETDLKEMFEFISEIPKEKHHYAYEQGKWTVAQLIQHCIDTERVFQYRAFSIARGEKQNLNGFDENKYADSLPSNLIDFDGLLSEMKCLRKSTTTLFKNFPKETLEEIGLANNSGLSTRATGFIILGHWQHHLDVLKSRYLD